MFHQIGRKPSDGPFNSDREQTMSTGTDALAQIDHYPFLLFVQLRLKHPPWGSMAERQRCFAYIYRLSNALQSDNFGVVEHYEFDEGFFSVILRGLQETILREQCLGNLKDLPQLTGSAPVINSSMAAPAVTAS